MPVSTGAPLVFQEIIDLVTTNYPAFVALPDPDQTGLPILFDPPGSLFSGAVASGIVLAMISPPNMTVPPAAIGPFLLWNSADATRIGVLFDIGHPIVAPDVFVEFTSAVYADSVGGDSSAQGDTAVQIDAYRTAHPELLLLGDYTSQYRDLGPPDPLFFAVLRSCWKTIA